MINSTLDLHKFKLGLYIFNVKSKFILQELLILDKTVL